MKPTASRFRIVHPSTSEKENGNHHRVESVIIIPPSREPGGILFRFGCISVRYLRPLLDPLVLRLVLEPLVLVLEPLTRLELLLLGLLLELLVPLGRLELLLDGRLTLLPLLVLLGREVLLLLLTLLLLRSPELVPLGRLVRLELLLDGRLTLLPLLLGRRLMLLPLLLPPLLLPPLLLLLALLLPWLMLPALWFGLTEAPLLSWGLGLSPLLWLAG